MGSLANNKPPVAPPTAAGNLAEWQRHFQNWIEQVNKGALACTGRVTLSANQNATTVTDARAGSTSYVGFMPLTSSAAMEQRNLVVNSIGDGFFTVSHTNNADTTRTFVYAIMG